MNAISKFLGISAMIILPWTLIRLTNLESRILYFAEGIKIGDMGAIAILIIPPFILVTTKWLFEPSSNTHKTYSGGKDLLVKFHK
jgi:hypothetical protein